MTRQADTSVRNHFMLAVRNVTPESVRHEVQVLFAPVSHSPALSERCAAVLPEAERHVLKRKKGAGQRAGFAQRRAFRRFCAAAALETSRPLSEIVFCETEKGRPYLRDAPALCISFSSCRFGMLGAWSSACEVGVDIEDSTRNLDALALARQFYSTAETATVAGLRGENRLAVFYRLWSLKEAALKSIGEGLPFGLDAFEFELHPGPRCVTSPANYGGPDRFVAHDIAGKGTSAALVMQQMA